MHRLERAYRLGDDGADVGRREVQLDVPGLEARRGEQRVDDRRDALGLRRDVAEEETTLVLPELDVLPQQRLREAVDRGQRRPQLV